MASYLHRLRDTVATTRRHVSDVQATVVLLLPGIIAVAALMLPP